MNKDKSIGQRLSEEILKHYKSKRQFALTIGLLPQSLNNYLKGDILPGRQMLEKFKKAGLDINYILYGEASGEVALRHSEPAEASQLRAELQQLHSEIARLHHELAKREGQIELLKSLLQEAERAKGGGVIPFKGADDPRLKPKQKPKVKPSD